MTVQELIDELQKIEDKSVPVEDDNDYEISSVTRINDFNGKLLAVCLDGLGDYYV